MDHQSDSEIVKALSERLTSLFSIKSWTFDKGFWHKDNKALLEECVDKGYGNFKRYIGLAVAAYNLRRIGQDLIATQRKQQLLLDFQTISLQWK